MLFAPVDCPAQVLHQPTPQEDASLRAFLRDCVKDPFEDYTATRYSAVFVDLRDDQTHEVIVRLSSDGWCGTGGCTTLILAPLGSSYKIISKITSTRLPIRVLSEKTNGWHDITVWVEGGGTQPGYEAELSFDGRSYPTNPSVPPARHLSEQVAGEVVIPSDAKDTPLF